MISPALLCAFPFLFFMFLPVLFLFLFSFAMSDPAAASTSLVGVPALVAAPVAVPEAEQYEVAVADPTIQVISVTMTFGDAYYAFSSPFSMDMFHNAIIVASAIVLASGDAHARVLRDGVIVFTPEIVPQDIPVSDFCLEVLAEYPSAFDVDNGIWILSMEFVFGSANVIILSSFPAHLVPWARHQARTMARALGTIAGASLQPPSHYPM
jgi:hypothetical protein